MVDDFQAKIAALEAELNQAKTENSVLTTRNDEISNRLTEQQSILKGLEDERDSLQAERNQDVASIKEVRTKTKKSNRSRSWTRKI